MSEMNSKLHNLIREITEAELKAIYYELFLKEDLSSIFALEEQICNLNLEKSRLISEGAIDEEPITTRERVDIGRDVICKDKILYDAIINYRSKRT